MLRDVWGVRLLFTSVASMPAGILVPAIVALSIAAQPAVPIPSDVKPEAPARGFEPASAVGQHRMYRVVVTLKGLEAGPVWAERIARARARVMHALKDHQVEVNREYDLIPALALTVDHDALRILRAHPDVASVAEDGTSTPGGGSTGTAK